MFATMAERVQAWWARRQFSRGREVPYDVGTYREAWAAYPALVRQYHPELNAGIVLSQIPPAADVLLLWQCETGHLFVATPTEQRGRPGTVRRRSAWCPECTLAARPPRVAGAWAAAPIQDASGPTPPPVRAASRPVAAAVPASRAPRARKARPVCDKTPAIPVGEAFASVCAPRPASAAEARVRSDLFSRLAVTPGMNAVRVGRPFFGHVEVWPDFVLPELRVAIEYDTTGRHGLEHTGPRVEVDRRKDRLLREAGWEVVRLRTGGLEALGPHDLTMKTVGRRGILQLIDVLREIRGALLVDAYLT